MFLNLFYGLRDEGVPVGIQEWTMLLRALEKGLHGSSLDRFYNVAKGCLIKSETYYDAFDRVFAREFSGIEFDAKVEDEIMRFLQDPKAFPELTEEQKAMLEQLSNDELMRRFLETMAEQDERHDGGGKWVGTGGRSPYGHGGYHPTGIRVGGPGRSRMAMKVWEEREFKEYSHEETLEVRQVKVALRKLRKLTRSGPLSELDLDETIDETCRNAGEIELVYRAEKRNNVRLLLLMDVGGTMDPYYAPVSRLLTALHEERSLRAFKPYYFHNCIYELVGTTANLYRSEAIPTGDLFRRYGPEWKVMVVGDAAMHPAELLASRGNINPRRETPTRGIEWLQRIEQHFERVVWLNPDPPDEWNRSQTCQIISRMFPMFRLSVDGVADAVSALVGGRR